MMGKRQKKYDCLSLPLYMNDMFVALLKVAQLVDQLNDISLP